MSFSTQVVIVGAGPVGTVAAYRLARLGIDVLVLEAHPSCPEDLRASTLHPPSLEMLDALGATEDLIAQGLAAPVYQYRNRQSGDVLSFDLGEIADVTRYPYRLQCEQFKLARLLAARLADHPHGTVRFSRRVVAFEQDETGVDVFVESPIEIETYRAQYLIACDGANSIVRKWLKIGFEGFTYPEKFVTVSTERRLEDYFDNLASVNYVADPDEWMVLLRVPSSWRVLIPAEESETDAYLLSDERKERIFENLIGDKTVKTLHRTIYRVHQRVAERYVDGRAALAGDAAHLNNPLGGFGMNSGIHDAWNLSDKLARILKDGEAAPPLLDLYERQRQAVMRSFVQTQTIRNKRELESADPDFQKRRQQEMEDILSDDARRRDYLLTQSMFKSLEQEAAIR